MTVGSEVSLWQPLLVEWVRWLRGSLSDISLRVHVDVPQDLIKQVASGMVDIAIMHAPQQLPGLKIDLLLEEKLVLVTSDPEARFMDGTDYLYIDWGPDFTIQHGMNFPDVSPDLFVDLGPLALSYVLSAGGSGYFRMSAVQSHLATGALHLVPEMPQFSCPVYAVHSANADMAIVGPALAGLHSVSHASTE